MIRRKTAVVLFWLGVVVGSVYGSVMAYWLVGR